MAIVSCEECGKPISDKAIACPHCGLPANNPSPASIASPPFRWTGVGKVNFSRETLKTLLLLMGWVAAAVVFLGVVFWLQFAFNIFNWNGWQSLSWFGVFMAAAFYVAGAGLLLYLTRRRYTKFGAIGSATIALSFALLSLWWLMPEDIEKTGGLFSRDKASPTVFRLLLSMISTTPLLFWLLRVRSLGPVARKDNRTTARSAEYPAIFIAVFSLVLVAYVGESKVYAAFAPKLAEADAILAMQEWTKGYDKEVVFSESGWKHAVADGIVEKDQISRVSNRPESYHFTQKGLALIGESNPWKDAIMSLQWIDGTPKTYVLFPVNDFKWRYLSNISIETSRKNGNWIKAVEGNGILSAPALTELEVYMPKDVGAHAFLFWNGNDWIPEPPGSN